MRSYCNALHMDKIVSFKQYECMNVSFNAAMSTSNCGNYVIDKESGEQCDGGRLTVEGHDPCCNVTCHLRSGMNCRYVNTTTTIWLILIIVIIMVYSIMAYTFLSFLVILIISVVRIVV